MKISILGVGRVGSATAFAIVLRGLADELVLVGRDSDRVLGDAYDLTHASAFVRPAVVRAGDIADTAGSDVLILTASRQDTGGSRLAMAEQNAEVVAELVEQAGPRSPEAVWVVVTNPVDVMTHLTLRLTRLPVGRVIGTGTLIDTGRFRALLSRSSGIHTHDIRAYVLGEHGDSQFAALSVASYGGVKFEPTDPQLHDLAAIAREGGYQVFKHKGHTNYAIAGATAMILTAIRDNTREVLPLSTLVDGYLGVGKVCLSVPCVVGREGIVRTLPIDLDPDETARFHASARIVRDATTRVFSLLGLED